MYTKAFKHAFFFTTFTLFFIGIAYATITIPQQCSDPTIECTVLEPIFQRLTLKNELKLRDDAEDNFIAIQAPDSLTSDTTFTLPDDDGSTGQVLGTDGSGQLQWSSPIAATPGTSPYGINMVDTINNDASSSIGCGTMYDATNAFQTAITTAHSTGQVIIVPQEGYTITQTLVIPDGVIIQGETIGNDAGQVPSSGSIICFTGSGYAFEFTGHTSGLKDIVIKDENQTAEGGVHILASSRLIEHLRFSNVNIINFLQGTGMKFTAEKSTSGTTGGGIAYSTFYDINIRHALRGMHIYEDPNHTNNFVNSNSFFHGVISGGPGIFDEALLVEGGNNNVFHSTVFEAKNTVNGHIVVKQGEFEGQQIRVEANNQASGVPVVHFYPNTNSSTITGTLAEGFVKDEGDNAALFSNSQAIDITTSGQNIFQNPTFHAANSTSIPGWEFSSPVAFEIRPESEQHFPAHKVIKVTIPANTTVEFEPTTAASPLSNLSSAFNGMTKQASIGFYVKTSLSDSVFSMLRALPGMANSYTHTGSSEWELIGQQATFDPSMPFDSRLRIENTTTSDQEVFITAPMFSFGQTLPTIDAPKLPTHGGQLYGNLTYNTADIDITNQLSNVNELIVPTYANVINLSGNGTINRLNNITANRIPKGTILTLLFETTGITVTDNNSYLKLKGASNSFASQEYSSLKLISLGDGTWQEVDRNE